MKQSEMGNYRLGENAKFDLKRIYMHGLHTFGEVQADKYFNEFFERFEQDFLPIKHNLVDIKNIVGLCYIVG